MEETQLTENAGSAEPKGCVNCGSKFVVEKYSTPLCSECRQLFVEFPIPLAVKAFGIGVALVLVYALISFPKNLSLAIHLEKGKKFEDQKQYVSAQREFAEVVDQMPDNQDANAHLLVASFYNVDIPTLVRAQDKIIGKHFEEKMLFYKIEDMLNRTKAMVIDQGIDDILLRYNNNEESVPDSVFDNYLKDNPENICALVMYSKRKYGQKNTAGCDTLVRRILQIDDEHLVALRMMAGIEREKGNMEESLKYCQKIIDLNHEAAYAYAMMARTYLKWNKQDEGMKWAEKCMALDRSDPYNMATLAIALHLNKQTAKSNEVLKEMKQRADSTTTEHMQFAIDVINHKESL